MTQEEVYDWMSNSLKSGDKEAETVLYWLMRADILSISKLVELQETAMKSRYDELKGDASEVCAVALMYKEEIYKHKDSKGKPTNGTKEDLDQRYFNVMNKLGFFKVKI
jgi:hypothetical protein